MDSFNKFKYLYTRQQKSNILFFWYYIDMSAHNFTNQVVIFEKQKYFNR